MNSLTSTSEQSSIVEAAAAIRAEAHIGKLLQDAGKLKPQDMERVLKLQQEQNLRFGEAAQKLGLVSEADIRQALSHQFEYPTIPAAEARLSPELTAATAPYGKEAEALRSVRSELLLRWFHDGRKTLAIGSARADVLELKQQREEATLLARDLENAQRIYDSALQRYGQSRMEAQSTQTDIAVLNPAVAPTEPSKPRVILNILLSLFLGTLLGVSLGFLIELLDRRVRSGQDIVATLGIPVLAEVTKKGRLEILRRMFRRSRPAMA
ncbi:MAG: hypothetical protein M1449_07140 [Candidatus Thermoplasmatota archaeon]|nr:hypothetical protein [Candidatus Thermoplasmatota archaeon]